MITAEKIYRKILSIDKLINSEAFLIKYEGGTNIGYAGFMTFFKPEVGGYMVFGEDTTYVKDKP